jgi:hypothetical protein
MVVAMLGMATLGVAMLEAPPAAEASKPTSAAARPQG